jgi:ATPase subunit of ABC transporter with duplicated ATPase domains
MLKIKNLSINFSGISLFDDFSASVNHGDRIAIIGANGCGKSSLLRAIISEIEFNGQIKIDGSIINIPQNTFINGKSGGESFNEHLTNLIANSPDLLLMDEPTNHLDIYNRKNLIRFVKKYHGAVVIASHDESFIKECCNILWIIEDRKIKIFHGCYDDYLRENEIKRHQIENEIAGLKHDNEKIHLEKMKEQDRLKNKKDRGGKAIENHRWPTVKSLTKLDRGNASSIDKMAKISEQKRELIENLNDIHKNKVVKLKFDIQSDNFHGAILSIRNGSIFRNSKKILDNINIEISSNDRVAIIGKNGSGKSSLVNAIIGNSEIERCGDWNLPNHNFIGYLDQHYRNLDQEVSIFDFVNSLKPDFDNIEIRKILNDFLFRKNEEVYNLIKNLSGGEMARLSLLQISLMNPRLLILDEVNNNLDITTKRYIINLLNKYSGAMIIISHDEDFLDKIGINKIFSPEQRNP